MGLSKPIIIQDSAVDISNLATKSDVDAIKNKVGNMRYIPTGEKRVFYEYDCTSRKPQGFTMLGHFVAKYTGVVKFSIENTSSSGMLCNIGKVDRNAKHINDLSNLEDLYGTVSGLCETTAFCNNPSSGSGAFALGWNFNASSTNPLTAYAYVEEGDTFILFLGTGSNLTGMKITASVTYSVVGVEE